MHKFGGVIWSWGGEFAAGLTSSVVGPRVFEFSLFDWDMDGID
jgi:hypothetical protein